MGFDVRNEELYEKALKHKSYNKTDNNERLEFLGDAILNQIISEILFYQNKKKSEGFLSKERSKVVSRKNLNKIGQKILKDVYIKNNLQKISEKIYGNTLEALIAAIYIDKGISYAKKFVKEKIMNNQPASQRPFIDYKTELQKTLHKEKKDLQYKLITTEGPEHKKQFTVAVFVNKKRRSSAKGRSIKKAEQEAAKRTLNIVI